MKNIFKIIFIFTVLILIFTNRDILIISTIESIELFNKALFPSIFPIMILSDFILSTNLINILSNYIGKVFSKIFKLNKISIYPFIMSCISGSPSNSKYINDLLINNYISNNEAIKLLSMCNLYNPLLIISLTNYLKFKDSIIIIIINILINIIIGLINKNYKIDNINKEFKSKRFNLVNSISNSVNTLISIFGIVTFFNIVNNLLPIKHPLITGIFELTNGLNLVGKISVSYKYKLIYTGILLSFSGLSIITQIKSVLDKKNTLNYSLYYKSKIIHILLFIIIIYICY